MRIIIYVDGESHFIRTQSAVRKKHANATLAAITSGTPARSDVMSFPLDRIPTCIRCDVVAKFFWDTFYPLLTPQPFSGHMITSGVYFTSVSGDDDAYHVACVNIRNNGFEPRIVHERKQLADKRKDRLDQGGILEKAKGVDIGLGVRLLEDCYHNHFDTCYLFTSDVDFLPVVRILQRMGKRVVVFGYLGGLGKNSEFEYVPDGFVDLTQHVQQRYYCPKSSQGSA